MKYIRALPCAVLFFITSLLSAAFGQVIQGTIDQENNPAWTGGAVNIASVNQVSQSFTPSLPCLVAVEVGLMTGNPGRGGDQVTLIILTSGGQQLASASYSIPEGFNGFWRFDLPNVAITPGQPVTIQLLDTNKIVFFWKYADGSQYTGGQAFFYGAAFGNNDFLFKTYGTTNCAPPYAPAYWNVQSFVGCNNCYNYACNMKTDTRAQPGLAHGIDLKLTLPYSCSNVGAAAKADGLMDAGTTGCGQCSDKVALVISTSDILDYHWYRLDDTGFWSHKPGRTPATNLDASNNTISDPETANRNYSGPDYVFEYNIFCGYYCVDKAKVAIGGRYTCP
jgi:hypothetical protein